MSLDQRKETNGVYLRPDQGEQASRAISVCSEVLQTNPENVNTLKDRAEAYIQEERYEEGKSVRVLSEEVIYLGMKRRAQCVQIESESRFELLVHLA